MQIALPHPISMREFQLLSLFTDGSATGTLTQTQLSDVVSIFEFMAIDITNNKKCFYILLYNFLI